MKALLLGDLSPTNSTNPLFEKHDIETLFSDTISVFENNDINFFNLECVLTNRSEAIEKFGPALKATAETAAVMKKLNFDYCTVCNNHFFDFGTDGVTDSFKVLDEVGITYTGFGKNYDDSRKNLIIEKNGEQICIITVCEHEYSYALDNRMGCRPFDEYDTMEDIRIAKKDCDRVIVIYHGGKEHCRYPSPRLHRVCHAMAKNGADVVICQHSHCLGCYEKYNNCHILYGQGNFHFVKPKELNPPETWHASMMVKYDTKSHEIEFIPTVNYDYKGITLAKNAEKEQIMQEFEKRNSELLNGEWKKGWHAFCETVRTRYTDAVKNAFNDDSSYTDNAFFSHYLDCEAHTDVWRELFPTANKTNCISEKAE